jgi:hypothetical protein
MNRSSRKNSTTKPPPKKKVKQLNAKLNGKNKNVSELASPQTQQSQPQIQQQQPPKKVDVPKKLAEEPKKLERSNSFIERTFTKFYNKLSGSIENLSKIASSPTSPKIPSKIESSSAELPNIPSPFKFQRSLTLNSFQLKKSYRKSVLENPRLEKLSEERISESDKLKSPVTPPKSPVTMRSRSPTTFRQSMPIGSYDTVDFTKPQPQQQQQQPKHSVASLPLPPKLERSDSLISIIRRKISFNDNKQPANTSGMNSNWAQSLQNLQQIDNLVSYEGNMNINVTKKSMLKLVFPFRSFVRRLR